MVTNGLLKKKEKCKMKCSICDKEIKFLEWFRYNYSCKECFLKEKQDKQKRIEKNKAKNHNDKIKKLKEQYPKRNNKALIYSLIISFIASGAFVGIIQNPLAFVGSFILVFGIIKTYHFFKYRPLKNENN